MSNGRPQYYENNLTLPEITQAALQGVLADLQAAVVDGVSTIESDYPPSGQYDGKGVFGGDIGIALAYLRLAHQTPSLAEQRVDFHSLAAARIPKDGPDFPLQIGGLSPLPSKSPLAAVVLRILQHSATGDAENISASDFTCLNDAVELALSHGSVALYNGHNLGADEVLFGRAGLLWALLNIRARESHFPTAQKQLLRPILESISKIISAIIQGGREGSAAYVEKHGEKGSLPLMWPWLPGHYGFGWAHGLTGILPILLSCRPEELHNDTDNYFPEIGITVTALSKICIEHEGHLPTMVPPRSSSPRSLELVQICHGAPAILALLGVAMQHTALVTDYWAPEWEQAISLATDRVWEEGLLSKGGSLCHGIAGNAWPLLLLHDAYEYHANDPQKAAENYSARTSRSVNPQNELTGDYFLARALAMLLHARETKPFNKDAEPALNDYRMPDQPYSFFEGLSGTLCAWAEACAVIRARLWRIERGGAGVEDDSVLRGLRQQQLGFPCLGGNGATGVL
ncbi:hypothetical protein BJY04DRAFT_194122 [Aspergillus karnatakaensis]|uniref:lanthionine synthetase C family protein n=1 Tax=Aspergillus karnatakaensis TaxID=1810916 RepID=UPI003CCD39CB